MRWPRLKAPASPAWVDRRFILGDEEKDKLVEFMRTYERLYGLRALAYCMMSNHFHILLEVPKRPADEELPGDAGLVGKVRACLGDKIATHLEWEHSDLRGIGAGR